MGMSLAIMLMLATFGSAFVDVNAGMPEVSGTVAMIWACCCCSVPVASLRRCSLQSWLLDAMEGPTPVFGADPCSDHGDAGVYLITRSNAIFAESSAASTAVVVVGTVTLLVRRLDRLRQGRHQEGAGRIDDVPDRLHDAGRGDWARRLRVRDLPSAHPGSSRLTCSSGPAR